MHDLLPQLIWLHTLDPWAIQVSHSIGIRWYGLSYILAFTIGWWILRTLARKSLTPIPPHHAFDAIITLAFAAVIGGRIGYAIFYQPSLLWTFTPNLPFWNLLALNNGGMASHGGMLGVVVAGFLIARGFKDDSGTRIGKSPPLHVGDLIALIATPGLFLGRIANFINGELLGKIVAAPGQPAPWWAVRFPQEHLTGHAPELTPDQSQQLAELLADAAPNATDYQSAYIRLMELIQHGNTDLAARLEPLISARHPSQLYQAAAEGIITGAICWIVARKPRPNGVILAIFLITYGLLRIATEFFRLPDDHLQTARIIGLSRGQWLSTIMILIGAAFLATAHKRTGPRFLGWKSHPSTESST